jgi:hypothetical protein
MHYSVNNVITVKANVFQSTCRLNFSIQNGETITEQMLRGRAVARLYSANPTSEKL